MGTNIVTKCNRSGAPRGLAGPPESFPSRQKYQKSAPLKMGKIGLKMTGQDPDFVISNKI